MPRHLVHLMLLVLLAPVPDGAFSADADDGARVTPASQVLEQGSASTVPAALPESSPELVHSPAQALPYGGRADGVPQTADSLAAEAQPVSQGAPTPTSPAGAPAPSPQPHIALLLPLNSAAFNRAAEAVRDGFLTAAETAADKVHLPVRDYPTDDTPGSVLASYRRAVESGARLVVGPMTREHVAELLRSRLISVPTLALNSPESETDLPRQFYSLSLSLDGEARQVAHFANAQKLHRALTLTAPDPLSRRTQAAFADEWRKLGGTLVADQALRNEAGAPVNLRAVLGTANPEVVFFAGDTAALRQARPYLAALPVYTTSQTFRGRNDLTTNLDLKGVHFVDMPWLLQPDLPTVSAYPRPQKTMAIELERLYALGVDASKISEWLLQHGDNAKPGSLDGVTGRITLGSGYLFNRQLPQAVFEENGNISVLSAAR